MYLLLCFATHFFANPNIILADVFVLAAQNLNLVFLFVVCFLVGHNFSVSLLHVLFQVIVLIVVLVFECKEVFIKRNSVLEKRLVATGLVLLLDLLVFQHLNFEFHHGNLLVQIENDVIFQLCILFFLSLCVGSLSHL